MRSYAIHHKSVACSHQGKQRELKYCNSWVVFNQTIIPLALVGYEIVIAKSALRAALAIYHLISNKREWKNY